MEKDIFDITKIWVESTFVQQFLVGGLGGHQPSGAFSEYGVIKIAFSTDEQFIMELYKMEIAQNQIMILTLLH